MNWLSGIGDFLEQGSKAYATVVGSTGSATPGANGSATPAALSSAGAPAAITGGINTNYLLIGGGVLLAGIAVFIALKK